MRKHKKIESLKEDIEREREQLNKIVIESKNKEKIIEISRKLDRLINNYYYINPDKKIAE